jgi:hypothetical protein
MEASVLETHVHLGRETQRPWNDLILTHTTPTLLALFRLVTLLAKQLTQPHRASLTRWSSGA